MTGSKVAEHSQIFKELIKIPECEQFESGCLKLNTMSFKVSAETKGKPLCSKISFKEGMHGVIYTLCTRSH